MPIALLEAHVAMLPRLQAEEQLRMIGAVGMGFGGGDDAKRIIRRLEAMADGDADAKPKFISPAQAAAALGIPIKRGRDAKT